MHKTLYNISRGECPPPLPMPAGADVRFWILNMQCCIVTTQMRCIFILVAELHFESSEFLVYRSIDPAVNRAGELTDGTVKIQDCMRHP